MEELRKIYGSEVQDPRLVPFDLTTVYAMGGGTPYGR
jgi:hypothetical protein